jgi:hypothetical protein
MATQNNANAANAANANANARAAGTPFVWAKLVQGKKMSLAETQAEEAAKYALANKVKAEITAKEKEQQLNKEKRVVSQIAKAKKDLIIRDAERETTIYSVENGYWHNGVIYDEDTFVFRDVPRNVNKHALDFAQKFFTYFGAKASTCTTLFELEKLFCEAYAPYALMNYQRSAPDFLEWEKKNFPLAAAGADKYENSDRYSHLQQWMTTEKLEWEALPKNAQYLICAPWSRWAIWIFLSNVSWGSFLKAIDEKSGAFENGILKIEGSPLNMASSIAWQVNFAPYIWIRFNEKSPCAAKKQRQLDEMD